MKIHCNYQKLVPIDTILLNKKNRNIHQQDQIDRLAKLIDHYGCRHPLIISSIDSECVAGEGRYLAMKQLGWDKVPVDIQEFKDRDEQIAFGIADNSIANWAELNFAGINLDMCELGPMDIELLGIKNFVIDMNEEEKPKKEKNAKICPECGCEF